MVHWRERSPPTNVAHVRWVEFFVGSRPCSERFFLRVLRFSLKKPTFQILIRSGAHEHVYTSFRAPKCFVGKQITFLHLWPNYNTQAFLSSSLLTRIIFLTASTDLHH